LGVGRPAQKSVSCFKNARAFSGMIVNYRSTENCSNLHPPQLIEGVHDLVADIADEP